MDVPGTPPRNPGRPLARPLEGIKVLDLSRVVSGPLCGRLLADLGADVVKIEPPAGDTTRIVAPEVDGVSAYFAQMNAGKRALCVDLRVDGAAEVVARLAGGCDVFLENFRPGVLDRYGLDAGTLLAAQSALDLLLGHRMGSGRTVGRAARVRADSCTRRSGRSSSPRA